ncbi:VRR-NUC domain-containing protein [Proteus sp. NMG38-2]|uniref:VRR-NUC domain-containing protein n=1 Tax=Proteus sp. NMG38-2 TaxID=2883107 RepID=UPI001D0AA298|nr:VRR-NUC domain-containing protein [Proteus sp. NMG38-2]UDN38139.1 VRR-NUC domain-containing protein [Proteus sp. NMG38-2]
MERHLVNEVKKADGITYKFTSPGHKSVPDSIVLLPNGKIIFVEHKTPGEKPRLDQLREHVRLFALGFHVVVLDSKDLTGI